MYAHTLVSHNRLNLYLDEHDMHWRSSTGPLPSLVVANQLLWIHHR